MARRLNWDVREEGRAKGRAREREVQEDQERGKSQEERTKKVNGCHGRIA